MAKRLGMGSQHWQNYRAREERRKQEELAALNWPGYSQEGWAMSGKTALSTPMLDLLPTKAVTLPLALGASVVKKLPSITGRAFKGKNQLKIDIPFSQWADDFGGKFKGKYAPVEEILSWWGRFAKGGSRAGTGKAKGELSNHQLYRSVDDRLKNIQNKVDEHGDPIISETYIKKVRSEFKTPKTDRERSSIAKILTSVDSAIPSGGYTPDANLKTSIAGKLNRLGISGDKSVRVKDLVSRMNSAGIKISEDSPVPVWESALEELRGRVGQLPSQMVTNPSRPRVAERVKGSIARGVQRRGLSQGIIIPTSEANREATNILKNLPENVQEQHRLIQSEYGILKPDIPDIQKHHGRAFYTYVDPIREGGIDPRNVLTVRGNVRTDPGSQHWRFHEDPELREYMERIKAPFWNPFYEKVAGRYRGLPQGVKDVMKMEPDLFDLNMMQAKRQYGILD